MPLNGSEHDDLSFRDGCSARSVPAEAPLDNGYGGIHTQQNGSCQ